MPYYYHTTNTANLTSILSNGLLLSHCSVNEHGFDLGDGKKTGMIHLAKTFQFAIEYRDFAVRLGYCEEKIIILEIQLTDDEEHRLKPDKDDNKKLARVCLHDIAASKIKLVDIQSNRFWLKKNTDLLYNVSPSTTENHYRFFPTSSSPISGSSSVQSTASSSSVATQGNQP
jgi:hypothetical protein